MRWQTLEIPLHIQKPNKVEHGRNEKQNKTKQNKTTTKTNCTRLRKSGSRSKVGSAINSVLKEVVLFK